LGHFGHEIMGRADADRDGFRVGDAKRPLHVAGGGFGVFGIHQDVDMRRAEAGQVRGVASKGATTLMPIPIS
jgi:hypothetical protein